MPEQAKRPPGRPRKWATEADRKRAYRARRARELAEPHKMRDEARQARDSAAAAHAEAEMARRAAQRAEQRVRTAERRAAKLVDQLRSARAETNRARQARDEARRLLRRKLGAVKDVATLRHDPDTLLAVLAEAQQLLAWYRNRLKQVERDLWQARRT